MDLALARFYEMPYFWQCDSAVFKSRLSLWIASAFAKPRKDGNRVNCFGELLLRKDGKRAILQFLREIAPIPSLRDLTLVLAWQSKE